MALWGNNDNVGSGGLVSLNYDTRVVTGAGTTFGETGAAKVGDVIRFGVRGGAGVYFGDAVIASIASTISCTIASTISTTTAQTTGGPQGYQKMDAGWVGVTTYMAQGVLRVKRETLVAASGITTGGIAYPTDVN